jgi:AcrR family transcriptional regulator
MTRRSQRWGPHSPADDDEARNLLLDAAEQCYERFGVDRATMDDIARVASVHRTTVYKYFAGRDEILGAVLLRDSEDVIAGAEERLRRPGPFGERMLAAVEHVAAGIEESAYLRLLFSPDAAGLTTRVAAASDAFRARAERALLPFVDEALVRGELRADLTVDEVVSWLVRISLLLMTPDGRGEPLGDAREDFRRFVLPGLLAEEPEKGGPVSRRRAGAGAAPGRARR